MKVKDDKLSISPSAALQRRTDIATSFENSQNHALNASDFADKTEQMPATLRDLLWVNPVSRRLAERRCHDARLHSVPYIIARQKMGENFFYNDGSVAYRLSHRPSGPTKTYNSDQNAWRSDYDKTEFFYVLHGREKMMPMGTITDLFRKGLGIGDVKSLLDINALGEEKDEDFILAQKEWISMSRAAFHLATASGAFFPKDDDAASYVFSAVDAEEKRKSIADVISLSSGHQKPRFLQAALQLRYDVSQWSRMTGSTPLENATNKGAEQSIMLINQRLSS